MLGTSRRPSADEIQELVELTSRDPGSPAFVDLGEAYLALGDPRKAIDVGARGLRANPQSLEGRMMVSRAFVALHQWKQAQAELLKVVKSNRSHAQGFLLLGEVLMRRGDYERAEPVLRHAQNLDPANPNLLDLLRRVRNRQPLDPPAPIPTPQEPEGLPAAMGPGMGMPHSAGPSAPTIAAPAFGEEEPTTVAPTVLASGGVMGQPAFSAGPHQPTAMLQGAEAMAEQFPPPAYDPGPAAPPLDMPPASPQYAEQPGAAGAPGGPSVRPRVLPTQKPKDAALAGLRQSAQVGENYLNNLLTAGLLDVPNVNAPEAPFELKATKRWGRSARRAFVFLFVLMFMGFGGGGFWYFYAKQQRDQDIAKHLAKARNLMKSATYDDLEAAVEQVQKAIERDAGNTEAHAAFAVTTALSGLLYGLEDGAGDEVELALTSARRDIAQGDSGWRDIVLADVAYTLAVLPKLEQPKDRLEDARKNIEAFLDSNPEDHLARWMRGVAMQKAGDRRGAMAEYKRAEADGQGPVAATISIADMLLDDGKLAEARKRYDDALERAEGHALAVVGLALLRTEISAETDDAMGDLNVMKENQGPRVTAYRRLALAMANYVLEDYVQFDENVKKAIGVTEPRYLARIALARVYQGKIADAVEERKKIAWYGDKEPQTHPLVAQVDAEFLIARGLPETALRKVGKIESVRAQKLRGRALYDIGSAEAALAEFDKAVEVAPEDLEVLVWREAARLVAGGRKQRRDADAALDSLSRKSNSKMVRYVYGDALLRTGQRKEARRKLNESLEISAEEPNPLAYRSHTALARLDFASDQLESAAKHVNQALKLVPGYLPAIAIKGQIFLQRQDYAKAANTLAAVVEEGEVATGAIELGFAEALVSVRGKVTDEIRDKAREAVRRAKNKAAAADELARVAAMVDPALLTELGIDAPRR